MDRIRILLEETKNLNKIDIRRYDFYLSEKEQEEWSKHESDPLYNTLWFEAYAGGPDIEYSKTVVEIYSILPFYKKKLIVSDNDESEWEKVYHSGGEIIRPKNDKNFTADLMTGWWNPFALIFEISDRKKFRKEIRAAKNFSEWYEKFKEKNAKIFENIDFMKELNKFLKVVYTVGNTIPAPENIGGSGLDAWTHKLSYRIIANKSSAWENYISDFFGGLKNFIESNYLQTYFNNSTYKNVKSFWEKSKKNDVQNEGRLNKNLTYNKATGAVLDDWAIYFENATERINDRNDAIEKELRKVMNNA